MPINHHPAKCILCVGAGNALSMSLKSSSVREISRLRALSSMREKRRRAFMKKPAIHRWAKRFWKWASLIRPWKSGGNYLPSWSSPAFRACEDWSFRGMRYSFPSFTNRAPVWRNRKATPLSRHWRAMDCTHSYRHSRASGPDSPPTDTDSICGHSHGVRSISPSKGSQMMLLWRMGACKKRGSRRAACCRRDRGFHPAACLCRSGWCHSHHRRPGAPSAPPKQHSRRGRKPTVL